MSARKMNVGQRSALKGDGGWGGEGVGGRRMTNGIASPSTERTKRLRLRNGLDGMIEWLRKLVPIVRQPGKRE